MIHMAHRRRVVGTPTRPIVVRSDYDLWAAACAGIEPAEALHPRDREDLVFDLLGHGWSIREIAEHTRMTDYTTDRIVRRIRGDH